MAAMPLALALAKSWSADVRICVSVRIGGIGPK